MTVFLPLDNEVKYYRITQQVSMQEAKHALTIINLRCAVDEARTVEELKEVLLFILDFGMLKQVR